MSRLLDALDPVFRPKAIELLARCVEARIMVLIVDTLRTPEEQEEYVRRGVSWTMNSRHVVGRAIDIAPFSQYLLHGRDKLQWDGSDPVWAAIGAIGQRVGLQWGVWKDGRNIDLGHFEMG